MKYKASLDTFARIITIIFFIVIIAIGQQSVRSLIFAQEDSSAILAYSAMTVLFSSILLTCWLYAPQSYTVDNTNLSINRPIGKVKIKLSNINMVRSLADNVKFGKIKNFGVSGLLGYFGKFYTPGIGHTTFYATQRKNKILIETNTDEKIIITPNDSSLIEKLK